MWDMCAQDNLSLQLQFVINPHALGLRVGTVSVITDDCEAPAAVITVFAEVIGGLRGLCARL